MNRKSPMRKRKKPDIQGLVKSKTKNSSHEEEENEDEEEKKTNGKGKEKSLKPKKKLEEESGSTQESDFEPVLRDNFIDRWKKSLSDF